MFIGKNIIEIGNFKIAWYAVFILVGAILAYKLSQYFLKKKGYDPNSLENLFYVAFPSGIVGARVWWIIAENRPLEDVYKIWQGGLAIQGGVIFGALVGIIFMVTRRKNIPLLLATDCIVPTILLAQAIGRWGNYFNQEVYGYCVDKWDWLPSFFTDRLSIKLLTDGSGWETISGNYVYLCDGGASQMVLPLFLIESVVNVLGFFFIVYDIPKLFKYLSNKTNGKVKIVNGDLMGCYFVWYGIVRMIMEPLRNINFIMGTTDPNAQTQAMTSVKMSIFYIIIGLLVIVLCHLYDRFGKKKKLLDTNVISNNDSQVSIKEGKSYKSLVVTFGSIVFVFAFVIASVISRINSSNSLDIFIVFVIMFIIFIRVVTLVDFKKKNNEYK